jgi:membrane associated rhomboid family serine protease
MTDDRPGPGTAPRIVRLASTLAAPLLGLVAVMWLAELVDAAAGGALTAHGIGPRRIDGLEGILAAPLLHSGFGHLLSNTVPLLALGLLVAIRGRAWWLSITAVVWLGGGALVWLLGGGVNHVGASGLVFGYFGALLGAAVRTRRPASLAPALVAIFLYGSLLVGLVPQVGLSWESHLFGLVVGAVAAYRLAEPPPPPADEDGVLYPWELDEPWRVDEGTDGDADR